MAIERQTQERTERPAAWTIFVCPRCQLPGREGVCCWKTQTAQRVEYWERESVPVVPAVLSPETVEKVARAIGEIELHHYERQAIAALRAAGFVSEPSTGSPDGD